jgi:Lon protease-like protein
MTEMPMFPLGSVLFPSIFLPLHVFEERYRLLTRYCLDRDREFGVVLIERGSEVGGQDVRTSVGTAARIIEAAELDDGRWVLGTVGTRRIRVREWRPDDPYPIADVEDWDDTDAGDDTTHAYVAVVRRLRRVLGLKAELAEPAVDATIELSDDPALGSLQACAVAPLGPADQQRLLEAEGPAERLRLLEMLLTEESEYLAARLQMG